MVDLPLQTPPLRLEELVAALPGAVVAVDVSNRVLHWSPGAERLYGWTRAEALGRPVGELLLPPDDTRAEGILAANRAGQGYDGEYVVQHKDGRRLVVNVSNAPVLGDDGSVVAVVAVSLDVTAASSAMAARAAQLQEARSQAERLADRNARLVRISELLGAALSPAEVVEVVLAQGIAALGADAGGIAVVEGGRLHVLGSTGYEPHVVGTYEQLALDARTPLTDVLRTGTPMRTRSHGELAALYPDLPISSLSHSYAGVALEVDGRVLGVMALSAAYAGAFPDEDVDFLLTLGRQCAQALERGRLFAAEREAGRRTAFLAAASDRLATSLDYPTTLDAVAELAVPATGDWVSVHLLDAAGQPQLVTVHHRDPGLQSLLEEVFARYPLEVDGSPSMGMVMTEGRSLRLRDVGEPVLRALARDDWHLDALHRLGLGSALGVPLVVHGRTLGVLAVARAVSDGYGDDDVAFVEDLAHRMASAVDNALRYREQRETALTLQRSLLPSGLPDLPGLTVAHRYLPGTAGAEVGGDWYDLIPLTRGRVGLVVGDVMGRGMAAAAVMGQLRAAVRACALVEDSPAAVLSLVDAAMSSLGQTSLTTCLYGVFDPASRRLVLASAGHLPPLLVHRDGGGEYVEIDPGPPLGVAWHRPTEVEVDVPDGAVLVLFTDGLVEGREQPVETGLLALRNAVAASDLPPCDVEGLCDLLLRAVGRDGRPDDDSALMAVWTGSSERAGDGDAHLHLAGHLSEVARARHLTVRVAQRLGVDADDAALLVTELASNALRHGGPGVDLWVRPAEGGGLRVEMVDGHASSLPRVQDPDADAEGGRGLLIVSALARSWGTDRLAAGKCVWFELGPVDAA
ncbi:MAG: hypothetical protein JWN08_3076 [Frankiales bacterium]|nr:hypothetical protein [Frankiales bacterium]